MPWKGRGEKWYKGIKFARLKRWGASIISARDQLTVYREAVWIFQKKSRPSMTVINDQRPFDRVRGRKKRLTPEHFGCQGFCRGCFCYCFFLDSCSRPLLWTTRRFMCDHQKVVQFFFFFFLTIFEFTFLHCCSITKVDSVNAGGVLKSPNCNIPTFKCYINWWLHYQR